MSVQFRSITLYEASDFRRQTSGFSLKPETWSLKPDLEDIRPDEDAVLKTAGVNALRGSSPWSSALNETNSPVAQRRRHLVYTQSIDGSSPSRTTATVVRDDV